MQVDNKPSVCDIRETLLDLDKQRNEFRAEMDDISSILSSSSFLQVGLKNPLVDDEGFPLAGLDIHDVRTKRNRFAILATDFAIIDERIHDLLQEMHENARKSGTITKGEMKPRLPFGRVTQVVQGSPADKAGLLVGDRIIKFGHLLTTTLAGVNACYDAIPFVAQSSSNTGPLEISVIRLGREDDAVVVLVQLENERLGCLISKIT
jgi:hypothetical protein